jgi:hypothetical protein
MEASVSVQKSYDHSDLIDRATKVWQNAQLVYQSPSWDGKPEARAVAEEIGSTCPQCEPALVSLLCHESQLVVAYALLTLEMMGSAALLELPAEVLHRRSNITVSSGSFRIAMDVGGLARQIQKRALARARS